MYARTSARIAVFCIVAAAVLFLLTGCPAMGTVVVNNPNSYSVTADFLQGPQNLTLTVGAGASNTSAIAAGSYAVVVTKTAGGALVVSWNYVYFDAGTVQTLNVPIY
jgi:hypothetical protein